MIPMMTEKKKLCLSLLGIFFVIFILNSLMVRSAGDDYVYSFMWEGHSMYEPLSADARRIASFQDIAVSAWSYFLTWGGRIVAQSMAMFFLWMPRGVFNVAIALTVVFLVLLMQWTARGGKVTMELSAKSVLITGFFLWAFQANFCGIFLWLDGSCNYLWPMVFLLAWLLPYIRHYMTDGEARYGGWLSPLLFLLGLLAGNGNENTLCWIGLFGLFYLYHIYKKGEMQLWMLAGFLGLSIGYGILMLAPGNLVRMEENGRPQRHDHYCIQHGVRRGKDAHRHQYGGRAGKEPSYRLSDRSGSAVRRRGECAQAHAGEDDRRRGEIHARAS